VKQANKNLCSQLLAQQKWTVGGINKRTTNLGDLKDSVLELFFSFHCKKRAWALIGSVVGDALMLHVYIYFMF
jgi:hypothetical protein